MNRVSMVVFFAVASLLLFNACSDETPSAEGDLMLLYQETEPGIDPYMTRVLVTPQFMRMDEGADQSNFTLYDRVNNIIYAVAHDNRTIMTVSPVKDENEISRQLVLDAQKLDDQDMPSVEGKKPVHYRLKVNNKACADVFVIKDMHEEAVKAMSEFKRVLASIHLRNLTHTPADMQDECFLAHDVLSPSRTLQFGFPIMERSADGVTKLLIDFKRNYNAAKELFQLPAGYRQIDMNGNMVENQAL